MAKEHPLFWHNIQHGLFLLEKQLKDTDFIPDALIVVGRGGLVPGTLFAYRLNVKTVYNFSVQSYGDNKQGGDITVLQQPPESLSEYKDKKVLVFDDLSDSGNTLSYIVNSLKNDFKLSNVKSTTLCIKKGTNFVPDYYIQEYQPETWLVFPWEVSA